jgi:hypothetical protein
LVKGSSIFAKGIQVFTDSDFSHVAMIVREHDDNMYTLEANIKGGVVLRPIGETLAKVGSSIKQLVFRHLKVTRTEE